MSHACILFIFRHLYLCLSILPISSSSLLILSIFLLIFIISLLP